MLLSFPDILRSDPAAEQDIRKSVDLMLSLEYNGNYPSAMDEADPHHRRPEEKELVHWCHGAPGNPHNSTSTCLGPALQMFYYD